MYRVVENVGSARVPWSELALPAVVEDANGIRLLVVHDAVLVAHYDRARAYDSIAGVLRLGEDPGQTGYIPAEAFDRQRALNQFAPPSYSVPDRYWVAVEYGVTALAAEQLWAQRNRSDNPFVHLHTHSEFSQLDGYATLAEIGEAVLADRQSGVGITDHGNCAAHPALQKTADELGLHPVFGMEAYFVEDRKVKQDPGDYRHLVLWAQDESGLHNLWALSTEGYRDGFYRYPRIDWDSLARHRDGLLVSTACLRGPLAEPFLRGEEQRALANLARLGEIFGDRLFVELHTNQLPQQMKVNEWLTGVAAKSGIGLLAAVDSHYARADQRHDHKIWLAMQTNKELTEDSDLFAGGQDYHLMSLDEVRKSLGYLPDQVVDLAIENTGRLAASCTAEIVKKTVKPVYSRPTAEHPDPVARDVERFVDGALANWPERITRKGAVEQPYLDQFRYECQLLIEKGFAGYYLITADLVGWAKEHGILVGPGRGSGSASLLAFLHRITEVDPIEAELLFDRFMTKGRTSLPDFDIDFPSTRTDEVIGYVQQRWGHEHVARVGSHIRLKNRGTFKSVQRVLAAELPPDSFGAVTVISKYIEAAEASTAGLGLSWTELMDQVGELLAPLRERMPELFRVAEQFHLRLRSYGKHAAGIIIDPDADLETELPMRRGDTDDAPMVTQWDMDALEYVGKVKFDFLRLRNLDTIQTTIDLIKKDLGITVNPYEWIEEYEDPQVFEELAQGWTLGVFQVETPLGTRVTKQLKPHNRPDLANIVTLGRPGPLRSGLDKVYLRRRDGIEQVSYPDPRMEQVLANTYGVMLFQEDIMGLCLVLAGYASDEADDVRRILGKKKVDQVAEAGRKFVDRASQNGTDRQLALDLWAQMAEFARYAFNKAHAYSYATIGCWTAWLKTHYPRQSLTAAMVTIDKDRIPQFVNEARRLGYRVLPPDINLSKQGFTSHGLEIRYGFESVPGIGPAASLAVIEGQPYASYADFLDRRGKAADMGVVKKLVAIGAFDTLHPHRRALEASVIDATTGVADQCRFLRVELNEHNLPCGFDWASEEPKRGRSGKILKNQPPIPKRCTKACRHYTKKDPTDYSGLPFYTDEEIRDREVATLGVFLTSSPFDIIPAEVMAEFVTADELAVADNGEYPVVAVVISRRPDPQGRDFGFVSMLTPSGELSAIVFSREWQAFRKALRPRQMVIAAILKTADDRYRLTKLELL